jgi:hypothetical protein
VVADPTKSNSAAVTLMGLMMQDRLTLSCGQRAFFYGNGGVALTNYTVEPASAGTIDQYGWFTAGCSGGVAKLRARAFNNVNIIYATDVTLQ